MAGDVVLDADEEALAVSIEDPAGPFRVQVVQRVNADASVGQPVIDRKYFSILTVVCAVLSRLRLKDAGLPMPTRSGRLFPVSGARPRAAHRARAPLRVHRGWQAPPSAPRTSSGRRQGPPRRKGSACPQNAAAQGW